MIGGAIWEFWPMANSGITTAAAVDGSYQLDVGGNFTRNVSAQTNGCVSVNSDSVRKRGSNDGSARNFVPIAELDTAINDLKETWRHLVKLHNHSSSVTGEWVRGLPQGK